MPLNAYLKLKGQKLGDIPGPVTAPGREGTILVHSFDNRIIAPHDPATGRPAGKKQHHPLSILKEIDKSSPLLWSALANGEVLTVWELQLWTPGAGPSGADKLVYTISLTNARLVSLQGSMQSTAMMADAADAADTTPSSEEDASFTYDTITWTWNDGGVTATDSW